MAANDMGTNEAAIKVNLFDRNQDPELWAQAENFAGEPGKAYVFGHGTARSISDDRTGKGVNSVELDAKGLGKLLLDAGATQETPVVLSSCDTGRGHGSVARELSHYFIEVEAPTRTMWPKAENDREMIVNDIYGKRADGGRDVDDPGRMKVFYREDRIMCEVMSDACDTPESEKPASGVQSATDGFRLLNPRDGGQLPLSPLASKNAPLPAPDLAETMQADAVKARRNQELAKAYRELSPDEAIRRYPELNEAYHAREVFREHFPEDKQEQALQAFDAHAYNSLARGHVPASQADEADHARGDAYVDLSH